LPSMPETYPAGRRIFGSVTSDGCSCTAGSIGSTIAVTTPVRKLWRPVSIAARDGEHSGVAQKLRKLTPFAAISARTGMAGASGAAFHPNGGNAIWSMPRSSRTTTRMFGRSPAPGALGAVAWRSEVATSDAEPSVPSMGSASMAPIRSERSGRSAETGFCRG